MRRTTSAAGERSESPTELIARIAAEHGSTTVTGTGRHRLPPADGEVEAVVTRDPLPKRSMTRRLAPLAVGAVVMLVATTVATLARPTDDSTLAAPELSNAIVRTDPTTVEVPTPTPTPEVPPTPAPPPPPTAEAPTSTRRPAPAPTAQRAQQNRPAAAPAASGGVSAAAKLGWTLVESDEFNGGMSSKWTPYDGPGHAGNGRRTPDAISVENGMLVIRGDSDGNTGGMAWSENQRFGRWEMRARFPKGDDQYHPVLILWPQSGDMNDGETDFAETTSASDDVSFFLHHGNNDQEYAKKTIDITQWHNYAVEWVDGRLTGYIDGQKWFECTDRSKLPTSALHPTIQLDYFPDGGSPKPTEMDVDYLRIYK